MDEGCIQPLSSDPMINLNTTTFFLIIFLPFARNLHNLEHLTLTMMITKEHRSKGGEQHTQDSDTQHNHAHKWRLELKGQHKEFTTRMELKSLTQWIKCVGAESECLSMLRECLVICSMHLRVAFIAPRQPGVVGDQFRRQFLPSVEWCTGQSGAPPDSHCSCLVRDLLTYRAHPTVAPPSPLAHRTLSGAHWTVWCAQLTVGARHASLTNCATDRWPRAPLAHRTVRCTTGQSSEF
jgi:hypothetical protein